MLMTQQEDWLHALVHGGKLPQDAGIMFKGIERRIEMIKERETKHRKREQRLEAALREAEEALAHAIGVMPAYACEPCHKALATVRGVRNG